MSPFLAGTFVVLIIGALLYEVWQVAHGRPTISEQVWALNRLWPPVLFLAGLLAGHLFTCP